MTGDETEIHEVLRRRRSPYAFDPTPLGGEEIEALFEAARWAPSCFNEQPWSFVYATIDEPDTHTRLASTLVEKNRRWAERAPLLMISVARTSFARNGKPNRHAFHDVGLAVGNLLVEATARGLIVHQMAGFDRERARDVLAIPEGHEPVAGIAVGRPGDPTLLPEDLREREQATRTRKPIPEIAFRGRFGGI